MSADQAVGIGDGGLMEEHQYRARRQQGDEAAGVRAQIEPAGPSSDTTTEMGTRERARVEPTKANSSHDLHARRAALGLDAIGPDAIAPLLEGEDPQTTRAADARHCVLLYTELISFRRELLGRAQRAQEGLSGEVKQEAAVDITAIQAQVLAGEARLEFWYRRALELEGIDLDPEQREMRYQGQSLELTGREYQLLACLIQHPYQYLGARRLVRLAWADGLMDEQLRVYVVRLRGKLRQLGVPAQLANRPREGYSLIFD
jgi:hypothetical protein